MKNNLKISKQKLQQYGLGTIIFTLIIIHALLLYEQEENKEKKEKAITQRLQKLEEIISQKKQENEK